MEQTVHFLIRFPRGVCVEHDVLGSTWPIDGTPSPCDVVLPSATLQGENIHFPLDPPPGIDDGVLKRFDVFGGQPRTLWGNYQSRNSTSGEGDALLYCSVAITKFSGSNGDDEREFAKATGAALNRWVESLALWLEVLMEADLQPYPRTVDREDYIEGLPVTVGANGRTDWFANVDPVVSVYTESVPVTAEVWASAIERVNGEIVVPSAHRYLRDSRAALRRDNYRKSIVDGATACEVALAQAIRDLGDRRQAEIDQLLEGAHGVMDLFDIHQVVASKPLTVSRARVMDQLAGKRNLAVHQGEIITREQASAGLAVAAEIVKSVSSL